MILRTLRGGFVYYTTTWLEPRVYVVLYTLLALGALWYFLSLVGERHERRLTELRICAAELALVKARAPYLERYVMPADPCQALRMVRL